MRGATILQQLLRHSVARVEQHRVHLGAMVLSHTKQHGDVWTPIAEPCLYTSIADTSRTSAHNTAVKWVRMCSSTSQLPPESQPDSQDILRERLLQAALKHVVRMACMQLQSDTKSLNHCNNNPSHLAAPARLVSCCTTCRSCGFGLFPSLCGIGNKWTNRLGAGMQGVVFRENNMVWCAHGVVRITLFLHTVFCRPVQLQARSGADKYA